MSDATESFEQWGILELLGHVRVAGIIREEERFGTKMGRIDIPDTHGGFTTQYFSGGAVYRLTPTTEEIARAVAARAQPEPVYRYELPRALAPAPTPSQDDRYGDDPRMAHGEEELGEERGVECGAVMYGINDGGLCADEDCDLVLCEACAERGQGYCAEHAREDRS